MFKYSQTYTEQSTKENYARKTVVLIYLDESVLSVISNNYEGDTNDVSLYFQNNKNCIYENENNIFVKLKSSTPFKSDVWVSMSEIYDKYKHAEVVLVFTGTFSYDCVYALVIKSYDYNFLKSKNASGMGKIKKIQIYSPENDKAFLVANMQNFARFLGDTPANLMTPTILSEYYLDFFKDTDIKSEVFDHRFLTDNGYNLIMAVGKGSYESPKLVHAKYLGRGGSNIDIALVGKGVTFDTGGISLKPASDMYKQKMDMMGSAICAAVLKLCSILKVKINISITLPLVENCPGSNAVKPGDVIKSKSGLTVDVDNTDAEGRLILADANTFAQQDNVKYLFNVATLTGAVRIALGNVFGGYFTNEEALQSIIDESSEKTGDLLWRLPLHPGYASALDTNIADICNSCRSKKEAGGSVAAEFIHKFVNSDVKWAHFDISNVKINHYINEIFGKHTTGRPIPALFEAVCAISEQFK